MQQIENSQQRWKYKPPEDKVESLRTNKALPVLVYYFCNDCYWATPNHKDLTTHYRNRHAYNPDMINKAIMETQIVHVHNPVFTDKNEITDEGYKVILLGATVLDVPSQIICPVPGCDEAVTRNLLKFRNHWQKNHVPFDYFLGCKTCNYETKMLPQLKRHEKQHQKTTVGITENTIKCQEQKNAVFLDPGEFKLPWRLVSLVKNNKEVVQLHCKSQTPKPKTESDKFDSSDKNEVEESPEEQGKQNDKAKYKCPVPACANKGFDFEGFHQHWKKKHHKTIASNMRAELECFSCTGVSFKTEAYMKIHYRQAHMFSGKSLEDAVQKSLENASKNMHYVSPGGHRLCPVEACEFKILSTPELQQHWRNIHTEEHVTHLCSQCPCAFELPSALHKHYKESHGLTGDDLDEAMENSSIQRELNPEFINPGVNKLDM